jgi:hypothetical protein
MEEFKNFDFIFYFDILKKTGAVLAMIISWSKNKSILMALVHGFFNWLYVIYYYITKQEDFEE